MGDYGFTGFPLMDVGAVPASLFPGNTSTGSRICGLCDLVRSRSYAISVDGSGGGLR